MTWSRVLLSAVLVAAVFATASPAQSIYPNDDCSTRGSSNYNAVDPFGLLVKNSSDVGWIEFDFGNTAATAVTLTIYNGDAGVSNLWNIVVRGAQYDFAEATFTGTSVSTWEVVGTIPGVMAIDFYSLDITDFYNAHLGQRITLQLGRDVQPGGSGPIFEDREGTKTGDGATYGPRLDVVVAPDNAWNPVPADGAINVSPDTVMQWSAGNGAALHEVYFGTSATPPSQGSQSETTFSAGILQHQTRYYWRVDELAARDTIVGPLWSFRTSVEGDIEPDGDVDFADVKALADDWLASDCDQGNLWCGWRDVDRNGSVNMLDYCRLAKNWLYGRTVKAAAPSPADGATDVDRRPELKWASDQFVDSHDLYFGTSNPPEFVGNQLTTSYQAGLLTANTTYYWRVDERTTGGGITVGNTWSFTTTSEPAEDEFSVVFPHTTWQTKSAEYLGLDGAKLDEFVSRVGGVGCIIRQGYMVRAWGETVKGDWASAAKPVLSTMLMFAIQEGKINGPHDKIADWGWAMSDKDKDMEFYHLANMISGYARGEAPGQAWAYNDYAISLYARTLFDKVFQSTPDAAATNANRLGVLQFQDGSIFSSRSGYGLYTSPRDFARIGWLWCNKGYWDGQQVLPRQFFEDYMKAQVPASLPHSTVAGTDYLGVGSYGGGSDQTPYGPGVYGYNWWCNPDRANWPDVPADAVQANGHWGGEVLTVIPSLSLVVACRGNNGSFEPGSVSSSMNQNLKLLVDACPPFPVGQIIVDPCEAGRMIYRDVYENGRPKPVCLAGPGDPEDFFYNNTQGDLDLLTSHGARCTYITAVLQDFGGGDPGTGTALDATLAQWETYIQQLEQAGIATVFVFFDDSQPLPDNWQELVDKCVAKFSHHKLLIWMVAEEYSEALTKAEVSEVAARIKKMDLFNHIVGVHQLSGNSFDFLNDSNIDMFMMQLSKTTAVGLHDLVRDSNANGLKIIDMSEAPNHAQQPRDVVRKWNWACIMGGASAVQVLDMGRATDPADWNSQDKYDDCARLMDFMELLRLNETRCRDDLARGDTDYVLANPGQVYILYGDSGASLGVNMEAGQYKVVWYDPVDSDIVNQGVVTVGAGDQDFAKPAQIGDESVLYLEASN